VAAVNEDALLLRLTTAEVTTDAGALALCCTLRFQQDEATRRIMQKPASAACCVHCITQLLRAVCSEPRGCCAASACGIVAFVTCGGSQRCLSDYTTSAYCCCRRGERGPPADAKVPIRHDQAGDRRAGAGHHRRQRCRARVLQSAGRSGGRCPAVLPGELALASLGSFAE